MDYILTNAIAKAIGVTQSESYDVVVYIEQDTVELLAVMADLTIKPRTLESEILDTDLEGVTLINAVYKLTGNSYEALYAVFPQVADQ